MEVALVLKIIVLVVGFYMAWNIGANDVSNAMGTSVGSGALTLFRAVILAAIFEFCGAFLLGSNVSQTMQKGIIDTELFTSQPMILVLGMCSALLGTGVWLQLASHFGWPVSTTHSIVGAIAGFGILVGGVEAIQWTEISTIAVSWVLSPVLSGVISYLIFSFLQKKILFALDPIAATKLLFPFFAFCLFGAFTLSISFNGLENLHIALSFSQTLGYAFLIATVAALLAYFFIQRASPQNKEIITRPSYQDVISLNKAIKHLQRVRRSAPPDVHLKVAQILSDVRTLSIQLHDETNFEKRASEYHVVEKMFIPLQIISACYVAFSHGANDVANAIGPVAAVLDILQSGGVSTIAVVSPSLLLLGGVAIVIGLATFGWKVIETIGKKITELTPTRGFCAEFGAAATILISSKMGLPVSTTHCLVGAVLGVGMARGIRALNLSTLRDIVLSWVVTIPASALITIAIFYLLKTIFL